MAYSDKEVSRTQGAPRELYRFVGTYSNYYYTSGPKRVSWQAPDEDEPQDYLPFTLNRSEVNAGTPDDDNLDLTVDLPVTAEVVIAYAFNTSPPDLNLTIWRYHTLDSVVPYWRGRITNISVEDGIASLTSPSELGTAMAQTLPNVFYQAPCNHVLYDARCKVPEADWTNATVVTNVAGKQVTVASIGPLDGDLIGGELALTSGERRMIVAQAANVLTVNFPFAKILVGDGAIIAAGCDYAYTGDCKLKFANQLNFGGFPFIPQGNVFQDGIEEGSRLADDTCIEEIYDPRMLILSFGTDRPGVQDNGFGANWNYPDVQPNPPYGKTVDGSPLGGPNWAINEAIAPELDPILTGQRLVTTSGSNFSWTTTFQYPISGHFTLQIQWSSGTFDTGDDTNRFSVYKSTKQGLVRVCYELVGNGVRYYEWDA